MPDTPDHAAVDPAREAKAPFDADQGTDGLDDHHNRDAARGSQHPGSTVDAGPGDVPVAQDPALPPENGRRATFDPQTGAVHGSGSGAGGGNPGEDFASDAAGGDGYAITGGEGLPKGGDTDLGPSSRD